MPQAKRARLPTSVRLDKDVDAQLKAMSAETGLPIGLIAEQAIKAALKSYREGDGHVPIPLEYEPLRKVVSRQ